MGVGTVEAGDVALRLLLLLLALLLTRSRIAYSKNRTLAVWRVRWISQATASNCIQQQQAQLFRHPLRLALSLPLIQPVALHPLHLLETQGCPMPSTP